MYPILWGRKPQTRASADPVRQGEIDSLIESLERRPVYNRRRARGGDDSAATTFPDGDSTTDDDAAPPPPAAAADGGYLAAHRGRMVRSVDGSWMFVSDDEARDGLRLTLLPCRMLERLEGIALREGDSTAVTLSGRVHRFRGDGYLLPTLFERERRAGVDPLQ